jgi:hypothetical protein
VVSFLGDAEFNALRTRANGRDQSMRESFVVPVNTQRREMAGNVILYVCSSPFTAPFSYPCEEVADTQFYTISSGFRLRTPMPPYLPPAEKSRQRLVEGIRGLDVVKRRSVRGGGRHLLFFAYALAMQVSFCPLSSWYFHPFPVFL